MNLFKNILPFKSVGSSGCTIFGLFQKSHLFTMLTCLIINFYDTTYLWVFIKIYLLYGQTLHETTGTQVKGCNLAKLFLVLLHLKKYRKTTYPTDSGHRYLPAVTETAVVMIKFRLLLGLNLLRWNFSLKYFASKLGSKVTV